MIKKSAVKALVWDVAVLVAVVEARHLGLVMADILVKAGHLGMVLVHRIILSHVP